MFEAIRGLSDTFYFHLITAGSADILDGHTFEAGDIQVSIDGGPYANVAALPVLANGQAPLALTAAELTANTQVMVRLRDQTAPKVFEDNTFPIRIKREPAVLTSGAVTAAASNDAFTVDYGASDDDLIGYGIIIKQGGRTAIGRIADNLAGALTVAYLNAPLFAIAAGDHYTLLPAMLADSVEASLADTGVAGRYLGTAAGTPTVTTVDISSVGVAFDGQYVGKTLEYLSGAAAAVPVSISGSMAASDVITHASLPAAPAVDDPFVIY